MRTFAHYALIIVATLLAACGGAQPPIGAPGSLPQIRTIATHAEHAGSWMLPEANGEDLLYASNTDADNVTVFTWPKGRVVGTLTGFGSYVALLGLCADAKGDVFVTAASQNDQGSIYEYAHGGSKPIAVLNDPGWPIACAVDPGSGNLAVANFFAAGSQYNHGNIAIYGSGQNQPTIYTAPGFNAYWAAAYDDNGDLFVSGVGGTSTIAKLPQGSNTFANITVNESLLADSLQWFKGQLIVASNPSKTRGPKTIARVALSGSEGTVVGTTLLNGPHGFANAQFWIQGKTIIGPGAKQLNLQCWHYPAGGNPSKILQEHNGAWSGVVVSVAPR